MKNNPENSPNRIQSEPDFAQTPPALQSAEKQRPSTNKGLKIAVAILALTTLAGLGFGVYGMTRKTETAEPQNSAANTAIEAELAELKSKYSVLQSYVKDLEASGTEVSEEAKNATVSETFAPAGGPYIKDSYFFVPEWGWKFKIPDGLVGLGFSVDYDEAHTGYDLPFIGFTAYPESSLIEHPQAQYYDDILTCSIINVNKSAVTSNNYQLSDDSKIIGDSVLRISKYTSSFCNFNHPDKTDAIYEQLKAMFQNPENI